MNDLAFDYDRQVWVEGAEAAVIRRKQLAETVALLESDRASAYLAGIGSGRSVETALAEARRALSLAESA